MIRVTVYAGASPRDTEDGPYEPSVGTCWVEERDLSEHLRKLGLEWRQADYFPDRQTVITLDPAPHPRSPDVGALVRKAAETLEETGLL